MRTIAQLSALIILVGAATGCDLGIKGSGGASFSSERDSQHSDVDGKFVTVYSTWLEFDRDLTIPVDTLFAQLNAGNKAFTDEAERYFKVGLDVLQQRHGLVFPSPTVSADPKARAIRLGATASDWVYSDSWNSPLVLAAISNRNYHEKIRWRGAIPGAVLSFNALQREKVDIYAKLEIEVEHETKPGVWKTAKLQQSGVASLQRDLADRITAAYGKYLQARFDANTNSPRFKGIHPNF